MGRIFKIGWLSLKWQWGLLAVDIPIFFKNNCHEENKNTFNREHLNGCHCIQPKQHMHGCSGSEIVVTQTFNLDHRLLQKYVVCKSQVEIGHKFLEIFLNLVDFTDFFLIKILYHFIFIFFKECFLTYSVRKLITFNIFSLEPTSWAQRH